MLKHATYPWAAVNRVQHKHRDSAFVVVACPNDEFPRNAIFSQIDVELGLKDECWPQGMQFRRRHGQNVLTVRGRALVNEQGGLVTCRAPELAAKPGQTKEGPV